MIEWWNDDHRPTDSLFDSPVERQMYNDINQYLYDLNGAIRPLGYYLDVEIQQPILDTYEKSKVHKIERAIENTDWAFLREEEGSNLSFLSIGDGAFFGLCSEGKEVIWNLGGNFKGEPAYNLPSNYWSYTLSTYSDPTIPNWVKEALDARRRFGLKEEWEKWFIDTWGILGETTSDKVLDYLQKTTCDFVITINSYDGVVAKRPVFVIECDGWGGGFIHDGKYRTTPLKSPYCDEKSRTQKMEMKLWYYRQIRLPFTIVPPLASSVKLGIDKIPECIQTTTLRLQITKILIDVLESLEIKDLDGVIPFLVPSYNWWSFFSNNIEQLNYSYTLRPSNLCPLEVYTEILRSGYEQYAGIDPEQEEYVSDRLSLNTEYGDVENYRRIFDCFGLETWPVSTLVVVTCNNSGEEIYQRFLHFPFEVINCENFPPQLVQGILASRIHLLNYYQQNTKVRDSFSQVNDYLPNYRNEESLS